MTPDQHALVSWATPEELDILWDYYETQNVDFDVGEPTEEEEGNTIARGFDVSTRAEDSTMMPHFNCVQMIGAEFDIESITLIGHPYTERGVMLFFSACGLVPTAQQVQQWCALARAANGAPVDCMVWAGSEERGDRRPIGCVRLRYQKYQL